MMSQNKNLDSLIANFHLLGSEEIVRTVIDHRLSKGATELKASQGLLWREAHSEGCHPCGNVGEEVEAALVFYGRIEGTDTALCLGCFEAAGVFSITEEAIKAAGTRHIGLRNHRFTAEALRDLLEAI